jgi:uncharacterized protein (DUF488 family)
MSSTTLWTVGHSNHSLERFLGLVRAHRIEAIADVRSWPRSRHASWFDREALARALRQAGVRYVFLGEELGGRPEDPSLYDEAGHVRYDALAATDSFKHGIARLGDGLDRMRIAVMCAEENPEHCHRRLLVARVLLEQQVRILHVRGNGSIQAELGFSDPNALFEEPLPWRSSASVSPRRLPRISSAA